MSLEKGNIGPQYIRLKFQREGNLRYDNDQHAFQETARVQSSTLTPMHQTVW